MIPIWNSGPCLRCGACVGTCPKGAITLRETGLTIDEKKCISCGICTRICPVNALEGIHDR